MTQQTMQTTIPAEKFQNAEQLWFWFLYARSVRNGPGPYDVPASHLRIAGRGNIGNETVFIWPTD